MIKKICFLILLTTASAAQAMIPMELHSGPNKTDLTGNGLTDYIFVAHYDKNTSHPDRGITFYIAKPEGGYSIMPVPETAGTSFTYFDQSLSVTNHLVTDYRLYQTPQQTLFVTAHKRGADPFTPQPVLFTIYRLKQSEDYPGVPLFSWHLVSSLTSEDRYISADLAFKECAQACFQLGTNTLPGES